MEEDLLLNRPYSGMFWFSDRSETLYPGTVEHLAGGTFRLTCIGDRQTYFHLQQESIICGRIEGLKHILLSGCLGTRGLNIDPEQTFGGIFSRAALGSELSVMAFPEHKRARVQLSELNGWIDHRAFLFHRGRRRFGLSSTTARAPRYVVHEKSPRITLTFSRSGSIAPGHHSEEAYLASAPIIEIESPKLTVTDTRREIDILQRFLTLCMGKPTTIQRVELSAMPRKHLERFPRFFALGLDSVYFDDFLVPTSRQKWLMPPDYSLTFEQVEPELNLLYPRFRAFDQNHPLLSQVLLSAYFSLDQPETLAFSNLVFAAEGFHRSSYVTDMMPKPEFRQAYLKPLRQAIPRLGNDGLEESIENAIGHANQPSLRMRLRFLIDAIPQDARSVIFRHFEPVEFIKRVVDTRNYMAHRDPTMADKAFQDMDLRFASMRLHAILICHLFASFGASEGLITQFADGLMRKRVGGWGTLDEEAWFSPSTI
jgi:hypothetical protein